MTMTNLQQLVATQAALDMRAVLDAARDSEPTDASWIDLIDAMSDERIAAAFASLVLLVVSVPASLVRYQREAIKPP